MKVLVQWSKAGPGDWEEVDSSAWAGLPSRPVPAGGELIDDAPGWVTALNVQGVEFTGYDHYAVEELADGSGGIRIIVWNDDPEDQDLAAVRRIRQDQGPFPRGFYGQVWTFFPLAPDPALGGVWNTQQTCEWFAEAGEVSEYFSGRLPGFPSEPPIPVRPWGELPVPASASVRHGVWMPPGLMDAHLRAQSRRGWREWTEGVPASELSGGRVRPQRAAGRWLKAKGTKTYFQRNTDVATGIHVATNEDDLNAVAGGGETEASGDHAAGASSLAYCFTTASGQPNNADWPSGTYRCQLDVSAAGANMSYGLLTLNGSAGHFGRVDSGLTADQESTAQAEAAFTGTGLKLATKSWDPAAGAAGDRFECLVAARNAAAMNAAQTITLTFDSDAFVDGPWTGPAQTIAATMVSAESLAAAATFLRTLADSLVGVVSLTASVLKFITLSATMATTEVIARAITRVVPRGVMAGTAALSTLASFFRTLAASEVSSATISTVASLSQALSAAMVGIASLSAILTKLVTLAASIAGSAALSVQSSFLRTLAAASSGVATLSKLASFLRTLAATAVGSTALSTVSSFLRTLSATATGVAALASSLLAKVTLAASSVGSAALSTVTSFLRTLAGTAAGAAALASAASLSQTLAAAASGVASLARSATFRLSLAASAIGSAVISATTSITYLVSLAASLVMSVLQRAGFAIRPSPGTVEVVAFARTLEFVDFARTVEAVGHARTVEDLGL